MFKWVKFPTSNQDDLILINFFTSPNNHIFGIIYHSYLWGICCER